MQHQPPTIWVLLLACSLGMVTVSFGQDHSIKPRQLDSAQTQPPAKIGHGENRSKVRNKNDGALASRELPRSGIKDLDQDGSANEFVELASVVETLPPGEVWLDGNAVDYYPEVAEDYDMFDVKGRVGMQFLKPYTDNHDSFVIAAPPGGPPILDSVGNVNVFDDFAFMPSLLFRVGVGPGSGRALSYDGGEAGVQVSGAILNLRGHLNRTLVLNMDQGSLTADNGITISVANPVELYKKFNNPFNDAGSAELTIGTRYFRMDQSLAAVLTDGANTRTITTSGLFQGLGLTGSLEFITPLTFQSGKLGQMSLYTFTRGSIIPGDNTRTALHQTTSIVGGMPVTTTADLQETRTEYIPIGEVEIGLQWGPTTQYNGTREPLTNVRVSGVGQVYWNAGVNSGFDATQGRFDRGNLYLVGVVVQGNF